MSTLALVVEHPAVRTLGWTLVHFLWQGAAIGLCVWAIARFAGLTAQGRYVTGVLGLVAMMASPAMTFVLMARGTAERATASNVTVPAGRSSASLPGESTTSAAGVTGESFSVVDRMRDGLPMATVAVWFAGVLLLTIRLAGGWAVALRLTRRGTRPVTADVDRLARRVAARLALDRVVRCLESTSIAVPVTVGWLKPVVLFPASALGGLSLPQIEALLAHELAHVRRHDYLVNLLQSAVETLLFYHPSVWWVSRRVRAEREHCCDDLAVGVCDRLVYATALSDLAALSVPPRLALAATDGALLNRVRRILGKSSDRDDAPRTGWAPLLLVLAVAAALVPRVDAASPVTATAPSIDVVTVEVPEPAALAWRVEPPSREIPVAFVDPVVPHMKVPSTSDGPADGEQDPIVRRKLVEADQKKLPLKEIVDLELELKALAAAQQRLESLVAKGLASQQDLREASERVEMLRRQVEIAQQRPAVSREGVSKDAAAIKERQKAIAELKRVVAESSKKDADSLERRKLQELSARQRDEIASRERQAFEQRYTEMLLREMSGRERSLAGSEAVADAAAQIRASDILVIEVAGEPDLPQAFIVQNDGTIRYPLIGVIKVIGLTSAQARGAIAKEFRDRKLGGDLTVTLRRPRGVSPAR
jgi:beta-lactamase regulating signal transducer with metallopeptidase domain